MADRRRQAAVVAEAVAAGTELAAYAAQTAACTRCRLAEGRTQVARMRPARSCLAPVAAAGVLVLALFLYYQARAGQRGVFAGKFIRKHQGFLHDA